MCWADVLAVFSDTASQTCSSIAVDEGGAIERDDEFGEMPQGKEAWERVAYIRALRL
ncbi:hypothetical protein V8C40DRAFT_242889 [Trichoderma camerunense]